MHYAVKFSKRMNCQGRLRVAELWSRFDRPSGGRLRFLAGMSGGAGFWPTARCERFPHSLRSQWVSGFRGVFGKRRPTAQLAWSKSVKSQQELVIRRQLQQLIE